MSSHLYSHAGQPLGAMAPAILQSSLVQVMHAGVQGCRMVCCIAHGMRDVPEEVMQRVKDEEM